MKLATGQIAAVGWLLGAAGLCAAAAVECTMPSSSLASPESVCGRASTALRRIHDLRLSGSLNEARELAETTLSCESIESDQRIDLHLELARIHDRFGLHRNTRPVRRALIEIATAEAISDPSASVRGKIELAKADYYYRAELEQRRFPTALRHANEAIRLLEQTGDKRRLADAVHRLGLIRMQRRELGKARELFDRSLELDAEAGARDFFRGEYHRHVGFVYWLSEDIPAAVPHLRDSLEYRRRAGAIDASLFAAISLGSGLVETGSPEEAKEHLLYALLIARKLNSPAGTARAASVLGSMYEKLGDRLSAQAAYELTRDAARSLGQDSLAERAEEALSRLKDQPTVEPAR